MRSIVERDGVNYMQNSLADGLEKLYQANISAASANAELSTMQKSEQLFCHFISSVIADYWFFTQNHGNQNYAEKAAQNQKMKYSIDQLLSFLQWSHNDLSEYKSSIQKLQNIIDMINRPLNSDFIAISHTRRTYFTNSRWHWICRNLRSSLSEAHSLYNRNFKPFLKFSMNN